MVEFLKILGRLMGKRRLTTSCDASSPRPILATQVWSYSPSAGEEWLFLRLSQTDEVVEQKTQDIRNPVSDIRCRLLAVGDFLVPLFYPHTSK